MSTIMPLIPRLMEYFIQHEEFESPISKVRLDHALEQLESKEKKQRLSDEDFNWTFTDYYVPMKYAVLNVIKDRHNGEHSNSDKSESEERYHQIQ